MILMFVWLLTQLSLPVTTFNSTHVYNSFNVRYTLAKPFEVWLQWDGKLVISLHDTNHQLCMPQELNWLACIESTIVIIVNLQIYHQEIKVQIICHGSHTKTFGQSLTCMNTKAHSYSYTHNYHSNSKTYTQLCMISTKITITTQPVTLLILIEQSVNVVTIMNE